MENSSSATSNTVEVRSSAPAIAKAAKILDAVAGASGPMGISEIARSVGLSKSTVHGLTNALLREGFLVPVDGGKGYILGPHLLDLGMKVRDQRLLDVAAGELEQVARRTGETALFGRLQGSRVVILARGESARALNLSAPVGSSVPLTAGALGKAYLASIGPALAARFLERNALPRYTDRSITDTHTYMEQVLEAAATGYATDRGEYLAGVSAVASAFSWLGGSYFVWAVGIDTTYREVELEQVGSMVRDAVEGILEQLEDSAPRSSRR